MLSVERSVQVSAAPREVLEFVCDLRAYMVFDTKIVKVLDNPPIDSDGNGFVVFRGSLRGLRGPKQRQSVKLDRWWSVTFTSDGPWLADRLMWMKGQFVAQPFSGGSLVTHSYRFRFKGPFGPLIERYARGWLDQDLHDELQRIKAHFDRRAAGLPPLELTHPRPSRTEEQRRRARVKVWKDYRPPGWV